jgi:hypothetical protein
MQLEAAGLANESKAAYAANFNRAMTEAIKAAGGLTIDSGASADLKRLLTELAKGSFAATGGKPKEEADRKLTTTGSKTSSEDRMNSLERIGFIFGAAAPSQDFARRTANATEGILSYLTSADKARNLTNPEPYVFSPSSL